MEKNKRTRIAAYGLIREGDAVLLCRLSKDVPQWNGWWTLPGGGIEFGETPEEAMVREVEEETGLTVTPRSIADIDTTVRSYENEEFHGIRILYHAAVTGGSLRHELSGSTDRCEWHSLDTVLDKPLVGLAKRAMRLL